LGGLREVNHHGGHGQLRAVRSVIVKLESFELVQRPTQVRVLAETVYS
jgi:hypothetical protein